MKQKAAESKGKEDEHHAKKKAKLENDNGKASNGKSRDEIAMEFDKFCKSTSEHLSIQQMRDILDANGQDPSGSDDAVVPRCQDMMFYGPLDKCPVCSYNLKYSGSHYSCKGAYSKWSTCTFTTRDCPRKEEPIRFPDFIQDTAIADLLKNHQGPKSRSQRAIISNNKPIEGMTISLSGRLSHTHVCLTTVLYRTDIAMHVLMMCQAHDSLICGTYNLYVLLQYYSGNLQASGGPAKQYWRSEIDKHGGKVANSVIGVSCLVVSAAETERGGSSKVAEAVQRGIPVVREEWLSDSIEKQEPQPLDAYDIVSDLAVDGQGIPWEKQDPSKEALKSIAAEVKVYGKRGVHKDTKLQEQGRKILEKDGLLYNCAFSVCDSGRGVNDYCVMQLITAPENKLYMYYKKGRVGDDPRAEERLEEWENLDAAIKEFARLFEELTGNEFEPWEREKKFKKKSQKFFIVDMDDGCDIRHGGLGLRQLGIAAVHSKLDPVVAHFMKVLCSQEIYRYALMEMGHDAPDLPMGMLSNLHVQRCEELLQVFIEKLKSMKETGQTGAAVWYDFSQRWFTMMHSTRPFIFRDFQDLADHVAAALETVRDITVASHLVGDMTSSTIDDPLFERYKKLGCSISPMKKDSDDYTMIVKYLEKTYEPYKVGEISYGVSVENVFAVELSACPSYDEIKKLPNKVLLWCGTRSSNLVRHLHKGFLPAICSLPVPGYMFGKAIVCSDAAAEAARYSFTAVDRPKGFLVLAVASLGDQITEVTSPPEETKSLEEKKVGVKGLGRKKTDEKEHFVWKDDIKVPCGRLMPSEHKDSLLEYNEYAAYDPKQVSMRFLVGVKFEEKHVEYDTAE
ncbi:hypothetical protein LguiA_012420 [Lonicera macranthoides]